jgi:hypothetical protein
MLLTEGVEGGLQVPDKVVKVAMLDETLVLVEEHTEKTRT